MVVEAEGVAFFASVGVGVARDHGVSAVPGFLFGLLRPGFFGMALGCGDFRLTLAFDVGRCLARRCIRFSLALLATIAE
ncbi:hypothetical protein [Streptomyces sp. NPDC051098]|uniref:hypothetical protein n=1 Tax=Streptomyces sp. NPDC051098 TaxID=3155411 RepID=UPI00341A8A1C